MYRQLSAILIGAGLLFLFACETVPQQPAEPAVVEAEIVEPEPEPEPEPEEAPVVEPVEEVEAEPVVEAPAPEPAGLLPRFYVVRLTPIDRDTLTKIAGYDFVYGDRTLWPLLYEANRDTLRQPENPDLIHPGLVLEIPSRDGELREGTWQESMQESGQEMEQESMQEPGQEMEQESMQEPEEEMMEQEAEQQMEAEQAEG